MILIVSNSAQERAVLTAVCESHGWTCTAAQSVREVRLLLQRIRPAVIVTRRELPDGYSDDVIATVRHHGLPQRVIVLLRAGTPSSETVRQLELGAFQIQRDPVRTEILSRLIAQLQEQAGGERLLQEEPAARLHFGGATLHVLERRLNTGNRTVVLTPRETTLLQLLHDSQGKVISYDLLYSEVLQRPFRGETSNMRVLLRLLCNSYRQLGLNLRDSIEVIPKSGYRVVRTPQR